MAASVPSCAYYVHKSIVRCEEDLTHEFKGHTNLCVEEIPPHSWLPQTGRRSRGPISRCLNGFLNSGQGGTVYVGIVDNGVVNGLPLTQYKKDHYAASLQDLMERYNPPVDLHRYKIKFVPVVDQNLSEDEIKKVLTFDSRETANEERRQKEHKTRTYHYCWCDKDAIARKNNGLVIQDYVMEIVIKPWRPGDPRNTLSLGQMKAHPIHKDEEGNVYSRGHGFNSKCSVSDVHKAAILEVKQHYTPKINKLKEEISELRKSVLSSAHNMSVT